MNIKKIASNKECRRLTTIFQNVLNNTNPIQQTVNALLLYHGIQLSLEDDVCQNGLVKSKRCVSEHGDISLTK